MKAAATLKTADARAVAVLKGEWTDFMIADALSASRAVRVRSKKLRNAQRALRAVVDDRGWKAYLDVEQCANARAEKELRALFRRMVAVFAFARPI